MSFPIQQVRKLTRHLQHLSKLSYMTSRLPSMNKDEKMNHIENCKGLIDKQKTFYGRLCLAASEDTDAADMNQISTLAIAFGYENLAICMDAMVRTLEQAAEQEVDSL